MSAVKSRASVVQSVVDEIRPRLSVAGIRLEQGRPVSTRESAELEARIGIPFPPSFRAFIETVGGLRLIADDGDELSFLGPDALAEAQREFAAEFMSWRGDASAETDELLEEFETWGGLPLRAVPILRSRGPLSSCKVLNFAGQVCDFHRGALELHPEGFTDLLASYLSNFVDGHQPGGLLDTMRAAQEQITEALASAASVDVAPDEGFEAVKARIRALEAKAIRGLRPPPQPPKKQKAKAKSTPSIKSRLKAKPAKVRPPRR